MRHYFQLILLTILLVISPTVENAAAADLSDASPLPLNVPATRKFRSGERHRFSVAANTGEALEIVADKKGVDIGLTIFAPDNTKISVSDAPSGFAGRETLFFIAEKSGEYRIEVTSKRPGNFTGEYTITLIKPKPGERKRFGTRRCDETIGRSAGSFARLGKPRRESRSSNCETPRGSRLI